jgi:hypothetical protein
MNELIETIFNGFTVDGVSVPVAYMFYQGHGEPYVIYMQTDADNSLSGDDELIGYVDYYDFDVYAKGNYTKIVESVKRLLKANGFVWQPSKTSPDMYETDTKYYHKTLCFAYLREEN